MLRTLTCYGEYNSSGIRPLIDQIDLPRKKGVKLSLARRMAKNYARKHGAVRFRTDKT